MLQLVHLRVGNGRKVNFWHGSWFGNVPFKVMVLGFFEFSRSKDALVKDLSGGDDFTTPSWNI